MWGYFNTQNNKIQIGNPVISSVDKYLVKNSIS